MNRRRFPRVIGLALFVLIGVADPQARPEQTAVPDARSAESPEHALLSRYCSGCHNEKTKQGNLVLTDLDIANVRAHAERWELVVRKLRARSMPPAGRPRPTEAGYDGIVSHLETSLDRAAAENPDPGRTDTFRRLNRIEYKNAIRDLLEIEIDADTMLPADDSSHGFDNISVGGLSPMLLERYLSAAQKISRLAVGTPVRSADSETIVLPTDLTQDERFDGQPYGTRAGVKVRYIFPADGEYQFELRLTRDRNDGIEGLTEPHQIDVSVDGAQLQVFTVKPMPRAASADPDSPQYALGQPADAHLNVRHHVTGGPHVVQVAFIKRPSALIETERQPYLGSYNSDRSPRTQPALHRLTIAGPFNPSGIGETQSRKRVFTCRPSKASEESSCARMILSTLARRAYRRPPANSEVQALVDFYEQGRADGTFEHGIEMALRAMLTSPPFLFRIEQEPSFAKLRGQSTWPSLQRFRARLAPVVLPVEQHSG